MQQKMALLELHLKKILPRIFLKFFPKRVLCAIGLILNKFKRGIVQKPDAVGT